MDSPFVVDEFLPPRRSLRIAMVSETYPPEVNGVASTVAQLVLGLRERGHEVQLVRPRQDPDGAGTGTHDDVLVSGLPIPRYPHLKMGLPSRRALVKRWSLQRPDVVHIATEGPLGWSALQAATHLKLPVTSDFRTNFQAYSRHYGIGWLHKPIQSYLRKFHNRSACTMVPTAALRDELAAQGFERLAVVARGVDTRRFSPTHRCQSLRSSWGASLSTQVVLHVGRIAPEKNLELLVQGFDAMSARNADLKLVFVGDGPLREQMQRRCSQAHFAGSRSGHDLAAHYASADMFLFPSLTETFGNVTPEAMASGLALLAFRHAAAGQLVYPGVNGLLAPVDEPAEFIRQAAELAANPPAARTIAQRARQSALEWGWERIVAQVEGVFLRAMHEADEASPQRRLRPLASSLSG